MSDKKSFDISAHTEEQIEKIFSEIESLSSDLQDHIEIQKIINQKLGGGIKLTLQFEPTGDPLTVYRVTPVSEDEWFQIDQKSTYSYPPNPEVGRANIKGVPVFYASFDVTTAIKEMKNKLDECKKFYVSEWRLVPKKTIYAHCLILNSTTHSSEDQFLYEIANNQVNQLTKLFHQIPKNINKGLVHAVRKLGDLFTIPGDSKYHITSAYAHSIIYEARKQNAYMPILIYPSVENNHQGINFAIHPELILNESFELKRVFNFSIPLESKTPLKAKDNVQIVERGIYAKGIIEWQTLQVSWTIGNQENVFVKTENGELIRGANVLEFKFIDSEVTIKNIIQQELKGEELRSRIEILAKKLEIDDPINYDGNEFEEIFILDLPENSVVETESGQKTILNIVMPIRWSQLYRKKDIKP